MAGGLWSALLLPLEAALIGGAAAVQRRGSARQARTLAALELLCLGDVTLQAEQLATLGPWSLVLSLLWVTLFVVKARALAWALQLRVTRLGWATLGPAAFVV